MVLPVPRPLGAPGDGQRAPLYRRGGAGLGRCSDTRWAGQLALCLQRGYAQGVRGSWLTFSALGLKHIRPTHTHTHTHAHTHRHTCAHRQTNTEIRTFFPDKLRQSRRADAAGPLGAQRLPLCPCSPTCSRNGIAAWLDGGESQAATGQELCRGLLQSRDVQNQLSPPLGQRTGE